MTEEKMIPLSVVDALIAELEQIYNLGNHWEAWLRLDAVIKDLKKEAVPIPEENKTMQEQEKPVHGNLEQKIRDRIAELESEKYQLGWSETFEQRRNLIDELRKLLE